MWLRAWFEGSPNTMRRLLNSSCFSFAAIRSRSKNNSSWLIRCGVVWRIFSKEKKQLLEQRWEMFSIPCPEEVYIFTELSSGLGRRLPCYNTNQYVTIVREEISRISNMMELKKKLEQQINRAWFWKSLGRNLHRDLKSSRPLMIQRVGRGNGASVVEGHIQTLNNFKLLSLYFWV